MNRELCFSGVCGLVLAASIALAADEFEQPPISYSQSTPSNAVARLQVEIERGQRTLDFDPKFGWLPSLLDALSISRDSQLLVFSKTSLQLDRIAPRTPRALYFNDDAYVGYCRAGQMLEISVADPKLGAVFYSLDQRQAPAPKIVRQTETCLQCHGTAQTNHVPGHIVRSVFADARGFPLLAEGTHRVDHRTPIENRWGGWYVTGNSGAASHLGNLVVRDPKRPRPWNDSGDQNLADLSDRISTADYLTSHSDLVALLVFEHQTHLQNLLTQANFAAQQALQYEAEFNRALGEPASNRLGSTQRRIESAGEKLVEGLLMVDEAPLAAPFVGNSGFAERFSQLGPADRQGRSLRDLDLSSRLFKRPCSYLIYSPAFDELPAEMKHFVVGRLREVLAGRGGEKYRHLTQSDRQAILEILTDTKPDLWAMPAK